MTKEEVLAVLDQIFAKVLDTPDIKLDYGSTANDVDKWNSITNITIISEIEKHFEIRFKLREIIKMKDVGALCDTILAKKQ